MVLPTKIPSLFRHWLLTFAVGYISFIPNQPLLTPCLNYRVCRRLNSTEWPCDCIFLFNYSTTARQSRYNTPVEGIKTNRKAVLSKWAPPTWSPKTAFPCFERIPLPARALRLSPCQPCFPPEASPPAVATAIPDTKIELEVNFGYFTRD